MDNALGQALRHLNLNLAELLTCSVSQGGHFPGPQFPLWSRSGLLRLSMESASDQSGRGPAPDSAAAILLFFFLKYLGFCEGEWGKVLRPREV